MILRPALRQFFQLHLIRRLFWITIAFAVLSLCLRYVVILVQQQRHLEQETISQLDFLYALVERTLGQTIEPNTNHLQLLLDTYADQHQSRQLILFDPQGIPIALTEQQGNTKQLRNLPVWHAHQPTQVVSDQTHLTVWRQLSRGYVLYARQPILEDPLGWSWWMLSMLLPINITVLYLILLFTPMWRFFNRLHELTEYGMTIDSVDHHQVISWRSQDQELQGFQYALHRISYRYHQKKSQLLHARQFQRAVVDTSPDVILQLDARGRVSFVNSSFERITTLPRERVLGRRLSQLVEAIHDPHHQVIRQLGQLSQHVRTVVRLVGSETDFDLWLNPLHDDQGKLSGYAGTLHEVSDYQQQLRTLQLSSEQARQRLTENERMLATMSHELRTPLNGILGMAQLLRETRLDQEQSEYARTLYNSGQAMLRLVNDILDLSKLEAGKMLTEQLEFDVLEVSTEVCDLMAANAAQKSLELISFIDPHCPRFLWGDPYRIRQILLNLIGNAIKFTQTGYVALTIRPVEQHDIENFDFANVPITSHTRWLMFRVSDSGVGIPTERQADLFQFFAQADRSVSRRFGGTGLGLAISRGLAEAMHGLIELQSEAGKGTTFSLYLPLEVQDIVPIYQRPRRLTHFDLVVFDPNPVNQLGLRRLMDALKIDGEIHDDLSQLAEVQEHFHHQELPILLIDYDLLKGQPIGTYLQQYPALANAYCILLSRQPLRSIPEQLYAGFNGFVLKPLRVEHLLAELLRIVDQEEEPIEEHLPQEEQQRMMAAFFASLKESEQEQPPALRVLLAEDNIVNQKVASKMLQKLGCEVILAENGRQALDKLASESKIDLILMDCRMPEMDGLEATREIRRQMNSIPIIALTANDRDEDREMCMDAGMDEFLAKPLDQHALGVLIRRFSLLR
jgi:PAS domain S-box-containing protein